MENSILKGFKDELEKDANLGAVVKAMKGVTQKTLTKVKGVTDDFAAGYKNQGKAGRPRKSKASDAGRFVSKNKKPLAIGAGGTTLAGGGAYMALKDEEKTAYYLQPTSDKKKADYKKETGNDRLKKHLKKASVKDQAVKNLLEKTAIIGPLVDIFNVGIPSGVGYLVGKNEAMSKNQAKQYLEPGTPLGHYLFVPGYTGYRAGKKQKAQYILDK